MLNKLAAVSWGVYGGTGITERQHANTLGSWGLNISLPGPQVYTLTRVRRYLNAACMWFGFSQNTEPL
jgi:hypothetical protein